VKPGRSNAFRRRLSMAVGLMGLAAAAIAHAQPLFPGQSVSATQAERGQAAYGESCASCHGANLANGEFGPALKGAVFSTHWRGQSQQALLNFVQSRMPPAGPGALPSQAYADIVAYIVKANAAAAPVGEPPEHNPTFVRERDAIFTATAAARKAKLDALAEVTDAALSHPPDSDWLIWRRTYQASGFSNLKQIDKRTVARLGHAWSWSLPQSENEITPLVHDGVMFIESGNMVQALDAASGDLLWQYIRPLPPELGAGRGTRIKTLAIYKDRLLVPTADEHLIALNFRTGKLIWDHEVVTPEQADRKGQPEGVALHMDGGPIVARGKVVIGVSLGIANARGGCFILALDADSGREVWRFNTIARPGEPGGDSWNGAPLNERYGGGVWTSGSYDSDRNLLFFGIGNTYDAGTLLLPKPVRGASNDALYTDSTVALDPDSGKLVWHFQHMNRDVWDMDWVFEQTLVTLPVNGVSRDLVVTGGKIAIFDAVDRATGAYVFSKDLGLQNLVVSIDPKTGHKTTNPSLEPESGKAKLLCPSSSGARSWPTTAYNPNTKILYVPMIESCADYTWNARSPAEVAAGGSDMQFPPRPMPGADGNFGRLQAVNLQTREVLWTVRQRAPVASSMLATAGGLIFSGSLDRRFHAYDDLTGKVLWEARLNASPSSSPVTYAVGGQQYVAVVTGGGGSFDAAGRGLTPEIENPTGGTTLVVFKLPDTAPSN